MSQVHLTKGENQVHLTKGENQVHLTKGENQVHLTKGENQVHITKGENQFYLTKGDNETHKLKYSSVLIEKVDVKSKNHMIAFLPTTVTAASTSVIPKELLALHL